MRFGKFLLNADLIDSHQLLAALDHQNRARTLLPLLAVKNRLLAADDALDLWDSAAECQPLFLALLTQENKLSRDKIVRLRAEWQMTAAPIGELLRRQGAISDYQLQSALRQFKANRPALQSQ